MTVPESNLNLRRFDLNLLPILKALLTTHSVARSAEILGLSQSATSGALTRLRGTFGDPLLVLVGRNLVPTPRAEELVPLLNDAFSDLQALFDRRAFVPKEEQRCFSISSSDYVIEQVGLPLIKLLAVEAPLVSIKFVGISETHRASMIGGEIDFMLTPQNLIATSSEEFHSLPLSVDEMVVISSASFPMPETGLDLETYLGAQHAAYGVSDSETFEQWALRERGLSRRNLVTLPQFAPLPRYVAATNCLATLPRHVADVLATPLGLKIWPVPFEMPKLEMALHWGQVLHQNPAHRWVRDVIARAWANSRAQV